MADHAGLPDAARARPVRCGRRRAHLRDLTWRAALLRTAGHPRRGLTGRRHGPRADLSPAGHRAGRGRRAPAQRRVGGPGGRRRRRAGRRAGAGAGADRCRGGAVAGGRRGRRDDLTAGSRRARDLSSAGGRGRALVGRASRIHSGSRCPPTPFRAGQRGDAGARARAGTQGRGCTAERHRRIAATATGLGHSTRRRRQAGRDCRGRADGGDRRQRDRRRGGRTRDGARRGSDDAGRADAVAAVGFRSDRHSSGRGGPIDQVPHFGAPPTGAGPAGRPDRHTKADSGKAFGSLTRASATRARPRCTSRSTCHRARGWL